MFGCCGKQIQFDDANLEEEFKDLKDLFDKNDKQAFESIKVNTFHPIFAKQIQSMLWEFRNDSQDALKEMNDEVEESAVPEKSQLAESMQKNDLAQSVSNIQQPEVDIDIEPVDQMVSFQKEVRQTNKPELAYVPIAPEQLQKSIQQPQAIQILKDAAPKSVEASGLNLSALQQNTGFQEIKPISTKTQERVEKNSEQIKKMEANDSKPADQKVHHVEKTVEKNNAKVQQRQQIFDFPAIQSTSAPEQAHSPDFNILKQQLDAQQQTFEQQMAVIREQQTKLLEAAKQEQQNRLEIEQLKSVIGDLKQGGFSELASQVKNLSVNKDSIKKLKRSYQNARLTLTQNSLCGFDGQNKIFDIDLGKPDTVQFDDQNMKIVVQHEEGPIVIRAESQNDYQKWVQGVNRSMENAKHPDKATKSLIMKLDSVRKELYVYKGENEQPSKVFQVGNCLIEFRKDGINASIKVRCQDGRKFSFSDKIEICQDWVKQFESVGGTLTINE